MILIDPNPAVGLATAEKLTEKYPDFFPTPPTVMELIAILCSNGMAIGICCVNDSGKRAPEGTLWAMDTVWKGRMSQGKAFYSGWYSNPAEAAAEVFESWQKHMQQISEQAHEGLGG